MGHARDMRGTCVGHGVAYNWFLPLFPSPPLPPQIFPSAIFTGPNQLRYAYLLSPVVRFLMLVLRPVTYPIAKGLDYLLGHEHETPFNRKVSL